MTANSQSTKVTGGITYLFLLAIVSEGWFFSHAGVSKGNKHSTLWFNLDECTYTCNNTAMGRRREAYHKIFHTSMQRRTSLWDLPSRPTVSTHSRKRCKILNVREMERLWTDVMLVFGVKIAVVVGNVRACTQNKTANPHCTKVKGGIRYLFFLAIVSEG